jgi:hypothetical protein
MTRKKSPAKLNEEKQDRADTWELVLSERARWETDLQQMLQTREFTINNMGHVEIDERIQDGHNARSASSSYGEPSIEDMVADKPGEGAVFIDRKDDAAYFEAWKEWKQRQVNLQQIRSELQEQAKHGNIAASRIVLVTAASLGKCDPSSGNVDSSDVAGTSISTVEPLPSGSEPPPTPAARHMKKMPVVAKKKEDGVRGRPPVDERYLNACTTLGLHSKQEVLKALRAVEEGEQSLSMEFRHKAYLGNRGGQAMFLALVSDSEDAGADAVELQGLCSLELQGQGLGNEAAIALASLLPRCPSLQSVNLARNHISETGVQTLLHVVQSHPSLESFNVEENPVPSWLRVRLKEVLSASKEDSWYTPSRQQSPVNKSLRRTPSSPRPKAAA